MAHWRDTYPKAICFNVAENVLVMNGVLVSKYEKLFPEFHQLGDVLAEKGKWRISAYDVGLH